MEFYNLFDILTVIVLLLAAVASAGRAVATWKRGIPVAYYLWLGSFISWIVSITLTLLNPSVVSGCGIENTPWMYVEGIHLGNGILS